MVTSQEVERTAKAMGVQLTGTFTDTSGTTHSYGGGTSSSAPTSTSTPTILQPVAQQIQASQPPKTTSIGFNAQTSPNYANTPISQITPFRSQTVTTQDLANSFNAGKMSNQNIVQQPFDPLRDVMNKVPKVTGNVPSPSEAQTFLEIPGTYMVKNVYAHTWETTSNPIKATVSFFKMASHPVQFFQESKALYQQQQSNIRVAESERTALETQYQTTSLYPTTFGIATYNEKANQYNSFLEKTKESPGMFYAGKVGGLATDIGLSYAGGYILGGTGIAGGITKSATSMANDLSVVASKVPLSISLGEKTLTFAKVVQMSPKIVGIGLLSAGIVAPAYTEAKSFQEQGLSPYAGLTFGATKGILTTGAFVGGAYAGTQVYNIVQQNRFITKFESTPVKVNQLDINNKFLVASGTKTIEGQEYKFYTGSRYQQIGDTYIGTGKGSVSPGVGSEAQVGTYQYTFKGTNMGQSQNEIGVTAVDIATKRIGGINVKYVQNQPLEIIKFQAEPTFTPSKFLSISQQSPLDENLINFKSAELNYVKAQGIQMNGEKPIANVEMTAYKYPAYGQSYKMNLQPSDLTLKSYGASGTTTATGTTLKLDQATLQRTTQSLFSGLSKASASDFIPKTFTQPVSVLKIAPISIQTTATKTLTAKSIFSIPMTTSAFKSEVTQKPAVGNIPAIGNIPTVGNTPRSFSGVSTTTIQIQPPAQTQSLQTIQVQQPFIPQMAFAPAPIGFVSPSFGFPNTGQGFPSFGGGRQVRGKRKYKYQPSLYALYFGIKARKIPKNAFSGLSIRPIIRSNRKIKSTRRKRR